MRKAASLLAVLAITTVVAAGCGSGTSAQPHQASIPGLTKQRLAILREGVIKDAAGMGEAHPTDGMVVATTQHAFFDAIHGPIMYTPNFKVYVVGFRGKLTGYGASRPSGLPIPKGTFAYEIHRADTLEVTDSGLMAKPLDLSRFGPAISLDL